MADLEVISLASCGYGILLLFPPKGISQIIIYQVASPSAAETAPVQFVSYNKAIAFYYSKIMLLLSSLQGRSEKTAAGHCCGKKGSEHHREKPEERTFELNTKKEKQNE